MLNILGGPDGLCQNNSTMLKTALRRQVNKGAWLCSNKFYLWILNFECHRIFTYQDILAFDFFQPFKNKIILGSRATSEPQEGGFGLRAVVCQALPQVVGELLIRGQSSFRRHIHDLSLSVLCLIAERTSKEMVQETTVSYDGTLGNIKKIIHTHTDQKQPQTG